MTAKETKEAQIRETRAAAGLRKILSEKNIATIKYPERQGDWLYITFKNGQTFGARGNVVDLVLNSKAPEKKVKAYTTPKNGEKIGKILITPDDAPAYWKQVFIVALFEVYGEKLAVRKLPGLTSCYHIETGVKVCTTDGSIQTCIDKALEIIEGVGKTEFISAVEKYRGIVAGYGEIEIKQEVE